MPKLRRALGVVALILLLAFIFLNRSEVQVNFLVGRITMPLGLVVLGCAGLGALAVWMFQAYKKTK